MEGISSVHQRLLICYNLRPCEHEVWLVVMEPHSALISHHTRFLGLESGVIILGLDLAWVRDLGDPWEKKNGLEMEPATIILWQGEHTAAIPTIFRGKDTEVGVREN